VLGPRLRLLDHEQLWLLALDATSCVIGLRRLAEGGRHGCAVLACDVLRAALTMGAASFVLAHNHPGGDPSPSRHDLTLTRRVADAAALIGLPLVDHVIVTRGSHVSLLDLGLIDATGGPVDSNRAIAESPPD
jgi:DNA repair protein RadC